MKSTRRWFLAGTGTVLAAAAASSLPTVPTAEASAAPSRTKGKDVWLGGRPQSEYVAHAMWDQNTFQQFVNTNFHVANGNGDRMVLRLQRVEDLRKQNLKSTTAFALCFQFVSGKVLPQGTYDFSNPQLGRFLLFVVTADKSRNASYVAVVNRL